jgi:hypothetical protein
MLRQYLEIGILEIIVVPGPMEVQIESRARIQSGMRCDSTGGAERHRLSNSDPPFRRRLNYAVLSAVLAALLFAASSAAQTTMINAASPSLADVRRAIASAVDGDTVIVPAGTAAWTSALTIKKGITIQGQTTVNSDTGVCNDLTILQDNFPAGYPGGEGFFHCTVNTGQFLRITGITFTNAPGNTAIQANGLIRVSGNSNTVRLDHLHFTNLRQANGVSIYDSIYGVSDHVVEDNIPGQFCQNRAFNGGVPYGDQSFAQPAGYGGPNFFFFEDWYVNNAGHVFSAAGGWDANNGGKYVLRHCHFYDVEILAHGTATAGRDRGGRAQELYSNDYHWSYFTTMDGISSGTMIAHDNTYVGIKPQGYGMQTYRCMHAYEPVFFGADGRNPWDYNVTESDGVTHIDGHPPYLFDSGTISSASGNDPCTITDTSKNWAPNRWVSYSLRRPSDGATAYVQSNTHHTLTVRQWSPGDAHWAAGQGYEIRRVLRAIDQPGSGTGDLLSGANPTPRWLNQVREGCYSWNNIYTPDGSHINFTPGINAGLGPGLVQGLDYFNDTPLPGYTPYTYPHPLTKGLPPPGQMTRNATENSQHNLRKERQPWGGKKLDRKKAKKGKGSSTNEMADGQDNLGK